MTGPYKKRLEGVMPSKDLKELLSQSLDLSQNPSIRSAHLDNNETKLADICQSLTPERAKGILNDWKKENAVSKAKWIPIPVIRAMEVLLDPKGREKLEEALPPVIACFYTVFTSS